MDAATLQARIYAGYDKAAKRIGFMTDQYRASSASNPLAAGNKLRSFNASFNAEDMKYGKPNKYGHPVWWGLFDGRLTQVGDYLKNSHDGTYFIAAQQTNLPIICVSCNVTVDVKRPQQQASVGALPYGGNTLAVETPLMTGWPCSILQGSKGEKSDMILPGDTKTPWWTVLLPKYDAVILRAGDIITDNNARRFVISGAELTDLGWRLTASQATT